MNKEKQLLQTVTKNIEHTLFTAGTSCCLVNIQKVWALTILASCFLGFSLSSVEEDGVRRLYVNSVKETGLASKKGKSLACCLFVCPPLLKSPWGVSGWWIRKICPKSSPVQIIQTLSHWKPLQGIWILFSKLRCIRNVTFLDFKSDSEPMSLGQVGNSILIWRDCPSLPSRMVWKS